MHKTGCLLLLFFLVLLACSTTGTKGVAMKVDRVVVGQLDVNCLIVSDGQGPDAVIIDPGDDADHIIDYITQKGLKPVAIVLTHAHYDHVCAVGDLKKKYGVPVIMHEAEKTTYQNTKELCISWGFSPEDFPSDYRTVKQGDKISAGRLSLEVIHTPGHTPGSMVLYGGGHVLTGDTLFERSVGRTDLPGGNTGQLMESLKKLTVLPPDTKVICGHGDDTTIGHEMKTNPYLKNGFKLKFL